MKNLLLILFLIGLVSCSSVSKKRTVDNSGNITIEEVEIEVEETEIVDTSADNELLEVIDFKGFTQKQIGHFWQANAKLNLVINSPEFEQFLYKRKKLRDTNGLTIPEILKVLRGKKPKLAFTMYYSRKSTVGYTYPNSNRIWFNSKFHNKYTVCKSAGNLGHEVSHKLGFKHAFKRTIDRIYSIPYTINAAFKELCK